jgi:hypothetical protein
MKLPAILPEAFLLAMPPEERKRLGRMGMTNEEARARFVSGQEHKLQALIHNYLQLKGIYYESDRMDKRTSGKKGRPDFRCCFNGYFVALEAKADGETLTAEQAREANRIRANGGKYAVCYTLQDAIQALNFLDDNQKPIKAL